MTTTNEKYVYGEDDIDEECDCARSDECDCGKYIDEEESDDDDSEDEQPFTSEELEKLNKQFPREMLVKMFDNLLKI